MRKFIIITIMALLLQSPAFAAQWGHECKPTYNGGYECKQVCTGFGCPFGGPKWSTVCKPTYGGGMKCRNRCRGFGCPLGSTY